MKNQIKILLIFSLFLGFSMRLSSQGNILGEYSGQLLIKGDHAHQCVLKITCRSRNEIQGEVLIQGPSYLDSYRCSFDFSGTYSNGYLEFTTFNQRGSQMCGYFNTTFYLWQENRNLKGNLGTGFTISVRKFSNYGTRECNTENGRSQVTKPAIKEAEIKTAPLKSCSCCSGTGNANGSSSSCMSCGGKGYTVEIWYDVNGYQHQNTHTCSGCNGSGAFPCGCCHGSGYSKY